MNIAYYQHHFVAPQSTNPQFAGMNAKASKVSKTVTPSESTAHTEEDEDSADVKRSLSMSDKAPLITSTEQSIENAAVKPKRKQKKEKL